MTPSTYHLHFQYFPPFSSFRLPVILKSHWRIVLSYILYRCFGELSMALCIPISCLMEKGRRLLGHLFQLFTLTSHQLLWKATAGPLLFVNVLFASAGGSQLLSRAEKKRNLTSSSIFFSSKHSLSFFFFVSAAFIAALYIDKDLEYVHTFMNVCFFPRLKVSPYWWLFTTRRWSMSRCAGHLREKGAGRWWRAS